MLPRLNSWLRLQTKYFHNPHLTSCLKGQKNPSRGELPALRHCQVVEHRFLATTRTQSSIAGRRSPSTCTEQQLELIAQIGSTCRSDEHLRQDLRVCGKAFILLAEPQAMRTLDIITESLRDLTAFACSTGCGSDTFGGTAPPDYRFCERPT